MTCATTLESSLDKAKIRLSSRSRLKDLEVVKRVDLLPILNREISALKGPRAGLMFHLDLLTLNYLIMQAPHYLGPMMAPCAARRYFVLANRAIELANWILSQVDKIPTYRVKARQHRNRSMGVAG